VWQEALPRTSDRAPSRTAEWVSSLRIVKKHPCWQHQTEIERERERHERKTTEIEKDEADKERERERERERRERDSPQEQQDESAGFLSSLSLTNASGVADGISPRRERETHRETETKRHRETERERETERYREREREREAVFRSSKMSQRASCRRSTWQTPLVLLMASAHPWTPQWSSSQETP
jgi:hypothetical protein